MRAVCSCACVPVCALSLVLAYGVRLRASLSFFWKNKPPHALPHEPIHNQPLDSTAQPLLMSVLLLLCCCCYGISLLVCCNAIFPAAAP